MRVSLPMPGEIVLDVVKKTMFEKAVFVSTGNDTVMTDAHRYEALRMVVPALQPIFPRLMSGHGRHYLGEITGEITTEDQLDYIFVSVLVH